MKKSIFTSLCIVMLVLGLFTGCGKTSTESPWLTSWRDASSKADETGKNIFIFFSNIGSDAKSQEINDYFSKPKFERKIAKNYVLLNIDFNSNQNEMEYDDLIAAYELVKKFSVQAIPSILITTPEGYVIGTVMYQDINQSPQKIFNKVQSYNKASKNVTKIRKNLDSITDDTKRLYAIDKLISNLDESYRYLLIELFGAIKEGDPENELGILSKYAMSFAYFDALSLFENDDAQGAIDIFLNLAESGEITKAEVQECYQTVAYLLAQTGLGTPDVLIEYLNKAIEADPDSKEVPAIQQTIQYISDVAGASK